MADHADVRSMEKIKNCDGISLGKKSHIDSARDQKENAGKQSEIDSTDTGASEKQLPPNDNARNQPKIDNITIKEAQMPVKKRAIRYNMSHQRRGLLLIFNNENFEPSAGKKKRSGTNQDLLKIVKCFTAIGYEIEQNDDFTVEQIKARVTECRNEDHSNCDSLAIFVLTHGNREKLYAKNGWYNPAEVLWGNLTSDKCPSLAGKPKLIFIQACQGTRLDPGVKLVAQPTPRLSQFDGAPSSYTLPVCADFLIGYPTFDGYTAFRNDENGSQWVTILCEVLERHHAKLDICSILTLVNQRVALELKSDNWKNKNKHEKRQVPYFRSSLIRHLVFGEKRRY